MNVSKTRSLSALALKLLWFLFFWQSVFNISERAVQCIIRFIKYLLKVLSTNGEELKKLSEEIPVTTKSVMKLLSLDNPGIINYVVCPKCNSIYEYEDCYTTLRNGNKESKLCKHICYPSHPHSSKRTPCNTLLMKTVKSINSFTVSNALMRWGVVFCKWQQRINAFGAIFGFKKYQNNRHWHYIISTDCYTCTLTI